MKNNTKTQRNWKTPIEEVFMKQGWGLPKGGYKTGTCIMPAPRRTPTVWVVRDTQTIEKLQTSCETNKPHSE